MRLQADDHGQVEFPRIVLEDPYQTFHGVFDGRKNGHPALRHADIDIEQRH